MFINETGGEICDGKYLPVEFPNHSGLKWDNVLFSFFLKQWIQNATTKAQWNSTYQMMMVLVYYLKT